MRRRLASMPPSTMGTVLKASRKQPDLAMTDLDRSLELKPSDVRALMARAELRLRAGDVAGATTDLEAADRYADYVDDIRLDIARNYERAGLFAQAKVQYDLWIPFHPNDARVFTALSARCWLGASSGQDLAAALTDCNTVARRMDKSNPANW